MFFQPPINKCIINFIQLISPYLNVSKFPLSSVQKNWEKFTDSVCAKSWKHINNIPGETQDKLTLYKYEYI